MPKILVVDDEPFIVKMVRTRLMSKGYEVESAFDGESCLDAVASFSPDLILIDIMMPPPDGMEVTRILKMDKQYRNIPIILLTAKSGAKEVDEALSCGADDYIIKPYDVDDLFSKVSSYLGPGN